MEPRPQSARARRWVFAAIFAAWLPTCADPQRARADEPPETAEEKRTLAALDLARLGFPGGGGFGVRGFPISRLALEAGATTFGLATTFELAVAAFPLELGVDRKVQPILRVGYRRMFVHEASDRVVRSALPRSARGLSEQIALEGARVDALFGALGVAYRFRRPMLLEVTAGYLAQVGTAKAKGGREALQLSEARFVVAEARFSILLPRGRRP